jgi:ABC transport system ATP-binding/permease protein
VTNLLNADGLTKTYGTRTVLDGVSLGVAADDRVGVVGRNGDGKSTLLRLLLRAEEPDAGRVTHTSGLRVGVLPQDVRLDPEATVRSVVVGERAEHEWAGSALAREVLAGLEVDDLDAVVGPMSGGERRRVALAALLLEPHDLLVLDEPTNHLDVEAVDWLAHHLRGRREALLVVTHDRWFLDLVTTRTWEVAGGAVHAYDGGYSAYVLARAERERVAAATEQRRQNLLRKELAWLRRGPPARTSKPRFRIDAANALIADEPPPRDSTELVRFATARLGRTVYELHDVDLTVPGRTLLSRLTWHVGPGDRIGVVGVNGSGKTTLLRLLTGAVAPAAGRVVRGTTVQAALLDQEVRALPEDSRVLAATEDVARTVDLGGGRSLTASQLLERFGFTGNRQWTAVRELSGGERRRLQLLRLLMAGPNVLLLDEPTNDLDIETLTVVEDFLDGWSGTLLVVSHDRWFLERTCDRVVALLGDGTLGDLPGGVEEYLERRRRLRVRSASDAAGRPAPPAGPGAGTPAVPSAGELRARRKEVQRLERVLERCERKEAELLARMAEVAADYEAVGALDAELRAVREERAAAEDAWLLLAD